MKGKKIRKHNSLLHVRQRESWKNIHKSALQSFALIFIGYERKQIKRYHLETNYDEKMN